MTKQIANSSNSFLFRESYIHSKIPRDYPQNPWGFITVPIPYLTHTHGNPHGNPHTHGSPDSLCHNATNGCLCIFECAGVILTSGGSSGGIWYERRCSGCQTCISRRERSSCVIYGAILVWYIVFCVLIRHSPSTGYLGVIPVKMDRLPFESQEQLRKMSTDRLRATLTKAGYDGDRISDMGRTELLDAMAEVRAHQDLSQEAAQTAVPTDESFSVGSEAGTEAVRLRV